MEDEPGTPVQPAQPGDTRGWADRNPKLSIVLIAAVFYIILAGMCVVVAVVLLRS